jgi:propanol-preferring alcohol dehydrogenase
LRAFGPKDVVIAVRACGICHSDAHYRAGFGNVAVPRTLGHEIAGLVTAVGTEVTQLAAGDRVAVHYLLSCGVCDACRRYGEQFCASGQMIGKHCDGGYAETIVIPANNAIPIRANVSFEAAAVMMCSTATAYHALKVAGFRPRMSVMILGYGGLGASALQLAMALGASAVAAVDSVPEKLAAAHAAGAMVAVDGKTFDIALDFTGRPEVVTAALRALSPRGTLVLVALSESTIAFNPYRDLLCQERRIVGCSDHLKEELSELMDLAAGGRIDISSVISRRVPLDAGEINRVLDDLDRGTSALRTVIV